MKKIKRLNYKRQELTVKSLRVTISSTGNGEVSMYWGTEGGLSLTPQEARKIGKKLLKYGKREAGR